MRCSSHPGALIGRMARRVHVRTNFQQQAVAQSKAPDPLSRLSAACCGAAYEPPALQLNSMSHGILAIQGGF